MTKKDIMEENNKQRMKYMQQMMARRTMESSSIDEFLKKNYDKAKLSDDSIYYLESSKGKGKEVKEGDSLAIQYKGMFLDGSTFDPGPVYKLVYSKDQSVIHVIQGWIKVLGKMHQGDKVKVLIPSTLGYGARGMGPIQPFTPLVFDMELLSVKSNK